MSELEELRAKIDEIDDKLIVLFEQRMKTAEQIAKYKREHNLDVLNQAREDEILNRISGKTTKPIAFYLSRLYRTIFEASKDYQKRFAFEKKYALIGQNISYSFSREIHGFFADYRYDVISLEGDELKDFFESRDYAGCNVTIPYKRDVYSLCTALSPQAQKIGCVNTVIAQADGSLYGDNTDYYGFSYLAKRTGVDFAGKKVLVFGNGATSATVCAVIGDLGGKLTVISRTGENNYANIAAHSDAEIIVNTTPVGTFPETENQITDLKKFPACTAVLDVVYNPMRSRLVQQAAELGLKASGGLPMLVAQAKRACELFGNCTIEDSEIERVIAKLTHQKQNIVLVGMPGCGKSTLSNALGQKLGRTVIDSDTLIEQRERMTIPHLFQKFGEVYFRARECEVLAEETKKTGVIIATGGGAVLNTRNRHNIRQNSAVVFVNRDLNLLGTQGRPLSQGDGALEKMYRERAELYRAVCDIEVTNNGTVEEAVAAICARLGYGADGV